MMSVAACMTPQKTVGDGPPRSHTMFSSNRISHVGGKVWQPFTAVPRRHVRHVTGAGFKGFGKVEEKAPTESKSCPCGSGLHYEKCCKVIHDGGLPETAEALMRARYCAYAKGLVDFVVQSTHPDNPLAADKQSLTNDVRATCDKIGWERLKVLEAEDGATPDEAFVTFQTWFKVRKQIGQRSKGWHTQTFVEKSRFLRDDGRWLYVNGDQNWEPKPK